METRELDAADALLESLIRAVGPDALLLDEDGQLLKVYGDVNDYVGLAAGSPVDTSVSSLLRDPWAQDVRIAVPTAIRSGVVHEGVARLSAGDPGRRDRVIVYPLLDEVRGRPLALAVFRRWREEPENAEALRNECLRTHMDLALSASSIGTWESDRRSDRRYWSPRTKAIMGKPESFEPTPGALGLLVHAEDRESFESGRAAYLRGEEPQAMRVRIVRDDGTVRWISIRGRRHTSGESDRLIGTVIDETDLIEQLEQLKARNNHLRLAETLSGTGYWSFNVGEEASDLMWSEEIYRIHGVDPIEYTPTLESAFAFYHEDDGVIVRGHVERAMAEKSGFRFVARIVRADGEVRTVSSLGLVQLDESGGTRSVFGVFQDITDAVAREDSLRLARDEAAHSNEELSRFSYVCSHDMKEPVRLIESMSEMLQEPGALEDVDDARELLGRIHRNTRRLRAVIDGLLAYSRAEAKIEFTAVDLNEIVAEIRENLALLIEELEPTFEIGELPTVHGARVHFVQLLQNLIGNALAYADTPSPRIAISSSDEEEGCLIVVEDDGPGIPEAQRERVFDIFTRLDLDEEGSGLGLSICKRIVAQYDGGIECSASELGGAKFTIRLPALRSGDAASNDRSGATPPIGKVA